MEIFTFILILLVIYKNDISRVIHAILQKFNHVLRQTQMRNIGFRQRQMRNVRFEHRRDHNRHRVVNLDEQDLD